MFTGAMGGPMAGLAPLIGEFLGAERADITLDVGDDGWTLTVGDDTRARRLRRPRRRRGRRAVTLTGITAHPAGPTLTITPSARDALVTVRHRVLGRARSGFTAPFSWAA